MRPIVAIVADIRKFDGEDWHCVPDQYMEALCEVANVVPLIVPALGADMDVDSLLGRIDGIMLSGSKANVHPSHFGIEAHEDYGPYDQCRDATTLPLVPAAVDKGVPLFAICRGIQELNVAMGGSLKANIQDVDGMLDHRAPETESRDDQFSMAHSITVREGGYLNEIIGSNVKVNSLHSQAIDSLASRLQVEAIADDDGTVEAVSVIDAKAFAIGVQWHPEYWATTDSASHKLFVAFGDAMRSYAQQRAQ